MKIEEFINLVRKGDTPLFSMIKSTLKKIQRFEVPIIPGVHSTLYWTHRASIGLWRSIMSVAYHQPLFRTRCSSCGPRLRIIHSGQGLPWLNGNVRISIGKDVMLYDKMTVVGLTIGDRPTLSIGDDTQISQPVSFFIGNRVSVGSQCLIGCKIIADNPGHRLNYRERISLPVEKSRIGTVIIGNYVWAALDSMIIGNVVIGTGAVIAARAVVTNDVPPFCVVAGSPARIVKKLEFPQEMVELLGEAEYKKYRDAKVNN